MMPSYSQNKWYAIYFVSYLCTMLYVMMNLMLAVVNETFTSRERDKFKKLFLHKRKACQHAFKLLVSKQDPDKMRFRQFEGLMRYYAPNKCTCIQDLFLFLFFLIQKFHAIANLCCMTRLYITVFNQIMSIPAITILYAFYSPTRHCFNVLSYECIGKRRFKLRGILVDLRRRDTSMGLTIL